MGVDSVAVVEEIFVEKDGVVGVDFGGTDFGVARVVETDPAVYTVPLFALTGAVFEVDFDGDGQDEVAFAVEDDGGEVLEVLSFLFVSGFGKPPLDGVGVDAIDGVVEDLGAVDGLIEEGPEGGVGCGSCGEVAREGDGTGHSYLAYLGPSNLRWAWRRRVQREFGDDVILIEGCDVGLPQLRSYRS